MKGVNTTMALNRDIRRDTISFLKSHLWLLLSMLLLQTAAALVCTLLYEAAQHLLFPGIPITTDVDTFLMRLEARPGAAAPLLSLLGSCRTVPYTAGELVLLAVHVLLKLTVQLTLQAGLISAALQLMNGKAASLRTPISILPQLPRLMLVQLYLLLRLALWCVPCVLLGIPIIGLTSVLVNAGAVQNGSAVHEILIFAATCISFLPLFIAGLRYSFAFTSAIDQPYLPITESIYDSTSLLHGRLWQYIRLQLPVICISIVCGVAVTAPIFFTETEEIITDATTLASVLGMLLEAYVLVLNCRFYQAYRPAPTTATAPAQDKPEKTADERMDDA